MSVALTVLVAWALYWYLRPGQPAVAQRVAWARLVYTALAFIGLWASLSAYDLAIGGDVSDAALHAGVAMHLSTASTMGALALCFFGVHLWFLSLAIWRSAHVPTWLAIVIGLAGASYVVLFIGRYFAPGLDLGWVLLLALGELVFMLWLLLVGWRRQA